MKSGMTVMKNQNDELVPTRRACIDYKKLNQATRKDHFPLLFFDQVLEKLIHIAPKDQYKITFTYPFGTFVYTRMHVEHFLRCMLSIFLDFVGGLRGAFERLKEYTIKVFMDDFTVYTNTFNACQGNLA
ncbi:hypothetical protein CR513_36878, partial [Mucuna pruriens]